MDRQLCKYHIQKPGVTLRAYCGRRIGTPGGKIYPGVQAMPKRWFDEHSYPEHVAPNTCRTCKKIAERKIKVYG